MSATATQQSFRVASRRAQSLLENHLASKRPPRTKTEKSNASDKSTETPWPKSIRYTFYTACAAAVPFSIGSFIAMSPRLRDSLSDETDPEQSGVTSNNLVHFVRQYWGNYEYIPPIDRVQLVNVVPGRKLEWQEDNWTSFLEFLGLYSPKEGGSVPFDPNEGVPITLENEPPAKIRYEQTSLARFLSPEYNPAGVKVRLSLLPNGVFGDQENSTHEFEFSVPTNTSLSALRNEINVSNGFDAVQKVNSLFSGQNILQNDEENIDWNGTYRCVLDFDSVSENQSLDDDTSAAFANAMTATQDKILQSSSQDTSKMILSNTSSHSSWAYNPSTNATGNSNSSNTSVSKFSSSSDSSTLSANTDPNVNNTRVEQLKYQISTLQKELKDPSSLRDRGKSYYFYMCFKL